MISTGMWLPRRSAIGRLAQVTSRAVEVRIVSEYDHFILTISNYNVPNLRDMITEAGFCIGQACNSL